MIKVLANSLVPIFAALLFGYIAGLRKVVDNKNVKSLATFVMSFALPCSLFASIAQMPHDLLWSQGRISLVFAVIYLSIFALTYFAAHAHGKDTVANNSVLALTLAFPNVAGVSLPLLQTVYGSQAIATVAVALAIGQRLDGENAGVAVVIGVRRWNVEDDAGGAGGIGGVSDGGAQRAGRCGICRGGDRKDGG